MADVKTINAAEYDVWIPPRIALMRLESITRERAITAIAVRLLAGTLRIAARTLKRVERGHDDQQDHYVVLKGDIIAGLGFSDGFWTTGDLTVIADRLDHVGYNHMAVPSRGPTVYLVGARFDPSGIEQICEQMGLDQNGQMPMAPAPPSSLALPAPVETSSKATLPEAHLKAWWTFYRAVTDPLAETEDYAREHVARCFPSHSVTRDRIRKLRGDGTPGPKSRPRTAE
jgi:hypothetical protein